MFGERNLRHLLRSYATYYNSARTHLSVNKDAPSPRAVHAVGRILPTPFLGGLHHLYVRVDFRQAQRVLLFEDEHGRGIFEYDRPSSFFGQYGDELVTEVGRYLDATLEAVLRNAAD